MKLKLHAWFMGKTFKKNAGKQPASLLLNHCQQESRQATFYPRIAKLYLIVFGNL